MNKLSPTSKISRNIDVVITQIVNDLVMMKPDDNPLIIARKTKNIGAFLNANCAMSSVY